MSTCSASGTDAGRQEVATFAGSNVDSRTMLHFRLRDAVLRPLLPPGWELDAPRHGCAAGANLRVTFIDTLAAFDAHGTPRSAVCYVLVGIAARRSDSSQGGLLLMAGLSPAGPGPYKTNASASAQVARGILHGTERSVAQESWSFQGSGGSIRLQLEFVRGVAAREQSRLQVFSGVVPAFSRIYRYDQFVDVIQEERLMKLEFTAAGDLFSSLFDGSEHLVCTLSIPSYSRSIFVPRPS
ncbi:MAG TPA: hypothetical protein VLK85_10765 [Ramlibacter sp.]|nr:hypothetical protein [Ramlibacter sp.]